jgi:trehalose synthase
VAAEFAALVHPEDIVFIHDPQPAGMLGAIQARGIPVVWRCHVGIDQPNDLARSAWEFLRPYVEPADAFVFSRPAFVWEWMDRDRVSIIHPSIDAFSPKNQEMTEEQAGAILRAVGLFDGGPEGAATFVREDGTPGRVNRPAELIQDDFVPAGSPVVAQVSRWDALKDPVGVVRFYGEHVGDRDAHLALAGPAPGTVSDDPEALAVLDSTRAARDELEPALRERIHLAVLPMEDAEENAAIVNALQRRSHVVVQKSLAEGFGLTVAEAMGKGRPVVASAIGGIQDQIVDGETGLLVADPTDGRAFGEAVSALLADPGRAGAMGAAGRERVRGEFLGPAHMIRYLELIKTLI